MPAKPMSFPPTLMVSASMRPAGREPSWAVTPAVVAPVHANDVNDVVRTAFSKPAAFAGAASDESDGSRRVGPARSHCALARMRRSHRPRRR